MTKKELMDRANCSKLFCSSLARASIHRMIKCEHKPIQFNIWYETCEKCGAFRETSPHGSLPKWFEPITGFRVQ